MAEYAFGPVTYYYDPAQVRISGNTIYLVDPGTMGSTVTFVYARWGPIPETLAEVKAPAPARAQEGLPAALPARPRP